MRQLDTKQNTRTNFKRTLMLKIFSNKLTTENTEIIKLIKPEIPKMPGRVVT